MARVQARWKQKSCVLRAPKSRELIVVEFVGTYKVRAPTTKERAAAGIDLTDSPASQLVLSRTRTREDDDAEPLDEGEEKHDGA